MTDATPTEIRNDAVAAKIGFIDEIKNDLHAVWAALAAEGHNLAVSVEAMYNKAVVASETQGKAFVTEVKPLVTATGETVKTDAELAAEDAVTETEGRNTDTADTQQGEQQA